MTRQRSTSRRGPGVVTWATLGLVMIVVLAVAVAGGLLWRGDVQAREHAAEQITSIRGQWKQVPSSAAEAAAGQPIGVVTIPRLGLEWPIVAGVSSDDLKSGVGWYRSTAWPGELGNSALAGLRVTHGGPFKGLLDLKPGDEVVVETAEATLRYQIAVPASELTVAVNADWVLDPVPGHPQVAPHQPVLTLTTAQDLVSSDDRSVAFATLVSRTER